MSTLLIIGTVIAFIGWLWLLTLAFQENALWGIGCLLLYPLGILYAITHLDKAWKPFLINIVGGVLIFMGIVSAVPDVKELENMTWAQEEIQKRLESGEMTEKEAQLESFKLLQAMAKGEIYEPGFSTQEKEPESKVGYTTRAVEAEEQTIYESEKKAIQDKKIRQAIINESRYKNIKKTSNRKRGYKIIQVEDASKYIGEDIKVTMKKGQIRSGVLVSTKGNKLNVERRTKAGRYSFNLEEKKIRQIEVDTWLD